MNCRVIIHSFFINATAFFVIIKNPPNGGFCVRIRLTFAELGRTTCLVMAKVFTFDNTAVACQEPGRLQRFAQVWFRLFQCLGNSVFDGACLARQTTAHNDCVYIVRRFALGDAKWLCDNHL